MSRAKPSLPGGATMVPLKGPPGASGSFMVRGQAVPCRCQTSAKKKRRHRDRHKLCGRQLADSKSRAGRHEEALALIQRIPADVTGKKSFLHGKCLLRSGNYQTAIPLLEHAFHLGRTPGVSAGLLAHACENLKSSDPDWLSKSRKWQKLALHHGLTMEMALPSTFVR